MNLNKMGSGRKLIQHIVRKTTDKNTPWNKKKQKEKLDNQKNPYNIINKR